MSKLTKKDLSVYNFLNDIDEDEPEVITRKATAIVPGARVTQKMVLHNGQPLLKKSVHLYREDLEDMLITIMSNPEKFDVENLEQNGSFTERMIYALAQRASEGDMDAIKYIFDRILGKPTQKKESRSISGTYEDFLKMLNKQEKQQEEERYGV